MSHIVAVHIGGTHIRIALEQMLFKPLEESLRKHIFHLDDLVITRAALGDDAGLLGALALARMKSA